MTQPSSAALMIAAPSSGSGKTVITLALLRALKTHGLVISGAKAGPDYIDPAFHAAACGYPSVNLDPWAMTQASLLHRASSQPGDFLLIEAMMGLYDGAADGSGSAAELATTLNIPVVLVVDAAKQSHSIAALVRGFRDHDASLNLAGVILNKVGSPRHEAMLSEALTAIDVSVFGALPRSEKLHLPERHLGLVQASENSQMEAFIGEAAALIAESCDLERIVGLFSEIRPASNERSFMPPLGQRISIARDTAFAFQYPHMLDAWQERGAELSFFSPLADEAPDEYANAVYLPGGYPELHAETLANAGAFMGGLRDAADRRTLIYGECGGYMVLGEGLIDADGTRHAMSGLLKLQTSFEKRKLHLGYRKMRAKGFVLGDQLKGHEFHYTSALKEEGAPLFEVEDAIGTQLGAMGLRQGNVMGSYIHVIDQAA